MKITYISQYSDIGNLISAEELRDRGGRAKLVFAPDWEAHIGNTYEWRDNHLGHGSCLVCVSSPNWNFWSAGALSYPLKYFQLEIVE